MTVKTYNKDDIIFVENEVAVILEGIVHVKSHAESILPPKLMAKYGEGDILGYELAGNLLII